jgi:hypothetical protein
MQKLRPREVDVLTYPNGAHMTFGASSPRVRFLDVYDFWHYLSIIKIVTPCFPQLVNITGLAKNYGKLINMNM